MKSSDHKKEYSQIAEAYRQITEGVGESALAADPSPENLRAYAEGDLAFIDGPLYRDVESISPSGGQPRDPNMAVESKIKNYVAQVIGAHPDSRKEVWSILTTTLTSDKLHFILSPDEARWVMGDSNELPDLTTSRFRVNPEESQRRDIKAQIQQDDREAAAAAPIQLPPPPGSPRAGAPAYESTLPSSLQDVLQRKISQALNEDLEFDLGTGKHATAVLRAAADFLGDELNHYKVNDFDDIHKDLRDKIAAMVIHDLQKQGILFRRLDWSEHTDEREETKQAIESYLRDNFEQLMDVAEDCAVERGDKPPADFGIDEFPDIEDDEMEADTPNPFNDDDTTRAARRGEAIQRRRPTSHPSFDEPSFGTDY
jgi:hypothetical protein